MLLAVIAAARPDYATRIISSAGGSISVSLSAAEDDVLSTMTLDVPKPGTWAMTGFNGVKLADTTATQAVLKVARALTDDDEGIKTVTITYTPTLVTSPAVTLTLDLLTVGDVVVTSSLLPYKGRFLGHPGPGTVNPYNRPLSGSSRKTYSCVAPATELLCGVLGQIASNQSPSESKSAGTGSVSLEFEFRGHRAASSPSLPGAAMCPARTFTHNIGTTVGGSGGDQRRIHRWDFYTKPRGATTGGSTTTAVLAVGSSAVDGHYVGAIFRPSSGPLKGTEITVTAYNGSTRTITFATQAHAITSGVTYAIGVKVTAGTTYHLAIRNLEASPAAKYVSLNAGSTFTGGTGSDQTARDFIPTGLTPPRRMGPFYGDFDNYVLEQSGGTYPNETYTMRNGMLGWFGWDYDVIDVGQLKITPQFFDTGGDSAYGGSVYKRVYIGGANNDKARVRWKQVSAAFTARYLWLKLYYAAGARPNQPLSVLVFNETDLVSVGSWTIDRAADGLVNDSTLATINSWSPTNQNDSIYTDYVRLDLGENKTFDLGDVYRLELSSTATNARYFGWATRNPNAGMAVYDDNSTALGINNRCGFWQAWREDPSNPGKIAYLEQKLGAAAWAPLQMYGSETGINVQLIAAFEAP